MNFLNPLVLIGLGAALLPILIHFLARHRKKEVRFPSIRLLERMRTESIRMLRIKQLLILLLRVLIIALIVLAFARPALKSALRGTTRTAGVIVIDSSASMGYVDNGEALFTRALRRAEDVLGMFDGDDLASVIFAGKIPAVIDSGLTTDYRRLAKTLDSRTNTLGACDPGSAIAVATDLLSSSGVVNREIFFLTDGLNTVNPDTVGLNNASLRVYEILLGPDGRNGAVVEDVRLADKVLSPGGSMSIEADVLLGVDRHEANVAVYLDGERKGKTTVSAEPGQRSTTRFTLAVEEPGWYTVSVEVDGGVFEPGETRYLTVHVPSPVNVLLVTGGPDDGYYLSRALSQRQDNPHFLLKQVPAALLSQEDLSSADVIILSGVEILGEAVYRSLVSRVIEHGVGLLVFPPENAVDLPLYADGLFRDIMPATAERQVILAEKETVRIDRFNFDHPVLEGILLSGGEFQQPDVSSYLRMSLPADAAVFAWLTDDSPAASTVECGNGSAIVWTIDANGIGNELPLTGVFVPLVINSVYYLARQELIGAAYETGVERIPLSNRIPHDLRVKVKPPEGPFRLVDVVQKTSGTGIEGLAADVPGVYSLAVGDNEPENFAVNVAPEEIVMTRRENRSPRALPRNVSWKKIRDTSHIRDVILKDRYGAELSGILLFLAVILLMLEMVLARRL